MMKLWLNNHDESEWPDLPVYQSEGACHVTGAEEHPSKEVIEKMCSESFFTHHKYLYVESTQRRVAGTVDEEQYVFPESPIISKSLHQGSSASNQSPRGFLSTVGFSRDRSSKFGPGEKTVEQGGESMDSRDYYYSYPVVEEMFGKERGCSMTPPDDAFSDTVDQELYELCESPHVALSSQGSSVPYHSSREFLSATRVSPDRSCSSKFGQGEQTIEQEGELTESCDDYYSYPAVEEVFGDEGDGPLSPPEDEFSASPQKKLVQTGHYGYEQVHDNRVVFLDGADDISENDEGGFEDEDGPKHVRLEDNTVYRELDKTNVGYMPLSKEQRSGEKPCFINSDSKELNTPMPQYSGDDSSAECYMCVDLLVESPRQGQDEDKRSSSGPLDSAEIFQNLEYKVKCDSNENC